MYVTAEALLGSARSILEFLLTDGTVDDAKYEKMYEKKVIAHNLRASKEQIIDDLNGVMSPLQRKMMRILPDHLDELNAHISELDNYIDSFMKPEEKQTVSTVHDVTGIGITSTQAITSVIGADMGHSPARISSRAGLCPSNTERAGKRRFEKNRKGNSLLRTTLVTCAHSTVRNKKSYFMHSS